MIIDVKYSNNLRCPCRSSVGASRQPSGNGWLSSTGRGSEVGVIGFNRVELIVAEDQIDAAVEQFNSVLGLRLPRPHAIEGRPVLSATDFNGGIELVAAVGGEGAFGAKLAEHGPGQIGPVVFEIDDIEAARGWLESRGLRIRYEYDSSAGNADEAAAGVYQLVLDPEQWFGFAVTLMRRTGQPPRAPQ